ncbi:MAG: TldD/PmbA family protein [Spirochaetes bacterium]|nr:TldD/PmbA family protein [Spirochaetota bacterium]
MSIDVIELQKKLTTIKAEYAEIRLSESHSTTIHLSKNMVETCKVGTSTQGSVRVYNKGCWGFFAFTSLSMIETALQRALQLSHMQKKEHAPSISSLQVNNIKEKTNAAIPLATVSLEEKMHCLQEYNAILKQSELIENTNVLYGDSVTRYVMCNTDGSSIEYDRSFCGLSLSAIAKDGTIIQPYGESVANYGGFEIAKDKHTLAQEVVQTATELVAAPQVKSGVYNVIVDPKLAGVFIHEAFGHLSEADFIYENPRMKEIMVIGKRFGPEILNVVDDGTLPYAGYIPCDDEGILPAKTYVIKNGILHSRLHSRETAVIMGEQVTGNARAISTSAIPIVRMTNTYIENGNSTVDELFEKLWNGIYVVGALGGQTNLEMFTFTPAYAYEIKKGKKTKKLRDCMLTGNVFVTLANIEAIANDCTLFGGLGGCGKQGQSPLPVSSGGPHVLIKNVLIGGKGAGSRKAKSKQHS